MEEFVARHPEDERAEHVGFDVREVQGVVFEVPVTGDWTEVVLVQDGFAHDEVLCLIVGGRAAGYSYGLALMPPEDRLKGDIGRREREHDL